MTVTKGSRIIYADLAISEPMTPDDLRHARQRLGLSQAKLGRLLGLSSQSVYMWEAGKTRLPPWLPLALRGISAQEGPNPPPADPA